LGGNQFQIPLARILEPDVRDPFLLARLSASAAMC
jgi:hypothetical protein